MNEGELDGFLIDSRGEDRLVVLREKEEKARQPRRKNENERQTRRSLVGRNKQRLTGETAKHKTSAP